jgi:hypothetical protein
LVRKDIPILDEITLEISDLIKTSGSTFLVITSGDHLNSSILHNRCYFLLPKDISQNICNKIINPGEVDKRDWFNPQIPFAKYVLITDPTDYHLLPQDQRLIGYFSEKIIAGEGIGRLYKKLDREYSIDGNLKVKIYERIGDYTKQDISDVEDYFQNKYPEFKNMYTFN